jgi:hypothetical protein
VDLEWIGDAPGPMWCPVCGRDIPDDTPVVMLPFRSALSIDPGVYALDIGLERPAMVMIGTPDSEMARDGFTGGIPCCDGECAETLQDHIETMRSVFEN